MLRRDKDNTSVDKPATKLVWSKDIANSILAVVFICCLWGTTLIIQGYKISGALVILINCFLINCFAYYLRGWYKQVIVSNEEHKEFKLLEGNDSIKLEIQLKYSEILDRMNYYVYHDGSLCGSGETEEAAIKDCEKTLRRRLEIQSNEQFAPRKYEKTINL